jgi:nitrogen regulatory protein P-II 2
MKLISAVLKPFKLEEVREALTGIGVTGMTVSEVDGYGRQRGHAEIYRGAEYQIRFVPKIKVEIVVPDALSAFAVAAVEAAARTGEVGDGKIFVSAIENTIRIRTGEIDDAAI